MCNENHVILSCFMSMVSINYEWCQTEDLIFQLLFFTSIKCETGPPMSGASITYF